MPLVCLQLAVGPQAPHVDMDTPFQPSELLLLADSDGRSTPAAGGAATSAAVVGADGSTAIVGQGRGVLAVFDVASLQIVDAIKVSNSPSSGLVC